MDEKTANTQWIGSISINQSRSVGTKIFQEDQNIKHGNDLEISKTIKTKDSKLDRNIKMM